MNLLITTLLGNLPGPICYGFINDKFKATNPKFAWKCTIFYFFIGFGSILLACYFRYNELSKREEPKEPKRKSRTSEIMAEVAEGSSIPVQDEKIAKPANEQEMSTRH